MKITLTGTFTQTYEVEAEFYEATTPYGILDEDIREYTRFPDRFIEDEFDLVVTGVVDDG